jgi:hypothetical protein
MNYTPYLFVLFLSCQKKDHHALSVVHVKYCCCDFDVAAAVGGFFGFCEKVGVGAVAVAENFRFFPFRTPDTMVLFPPVGNHSWDHLHLRHSFAEALLICKKNLFPALNPSKSSFVHDHALALSHQKIGDRTVDYS